MLKWWLTYAPAITVGLLGAILGYYFGLITVAAYVGGIVTGLAIIISVELSDIL